MGSLLLASGAEGLRHALPHSRIMLHQPHGGVQVCVYSFFGFLLFALSFLKLKSISYGKVRVTNNPFPDALA